MFVIGAALVALEIYFRIVTGTRLTQPVLRRPGPLTPPLRPLNHMAIQETSSAKPDGVARNFPTGEILRRIEAKGYRSSTVKLVEAEPRPPRRPLRRAWRASLLAGAACRSSGERSDRRPHRRRPRHRGLPPSPERPDPTTAAPAHDPRRSRPRLGPEGSRIRPRLRPVESASANSRSGSPLEFVARGSPRSRGRPGVGGPIWVERRASGDGKALERAFWDTPRDARRSAGHLKTFPGAPSPGLSSPCRCLERRASPADRGSPRSGRIQIHVPRRSAAVSARAAHRYESTSRRAARDHRDRE